MKIFRQLGKRLPALLIVQFQLLVDSLHKLLLTEGEFLRLIVSDLAKNSVKIRVAHAMDHIRLAPALQNSRRLHH